MLRTVVKALVVMTLGVVVLLNLDQVIFFFVQGFPKDRWGLLYALFFSVAMYEVTLISIAFAMYYAVFGGDESFDPEL